MSFSHLDHLVVTAPSLAEGVAYVRAQLGVTPQPGGRHPRMATHNCLFSLGPAAYLEVIAVDPEAPAPELPRWFRLDRGLPPRLATWVARTSDIRAAPAVFGRPEAMERGALRWEITLPDQGDLPFDGIAPTLIQWHTEPHPAAALPDGGCALVRLEGRHPQAAEITRLLERIGLGNEVQVAIQPGDGAPALIAQIRTPSGMRTLGA